MCKVTSETYDETDIELVVEFNRLWRFLERETRNEREERGVATEPNERTGNANKHR